MFRKIFNKVIKISKGILIKHKLTINKTINNKSKISKETFIIRVQIIGILFQRSQICTICKKTAKEAPHKNRKIVTIKINLKIIAIKITIIKKIIITTKGKIVIIQGNKPLEIQKKDNRQTRHHFGKRNKHRQLLTAILSVDLVVIKTLLITNLSEKI